MSAPRLTYLPDLLEAHFEELQYLWSRRRTVLRSAALTALELDVLEERIEAHAQGLLAVGDGMRSLITPALTGDDPDAAFAAAYAFLRLGTPSSAGAVVAAVARAAPRARRGIAEALCQAPAVVVEPHYAALTATEEPGARAVALEVRAFRKAVPAAQAAPALDMLLAHADAEVRRAGWRAAAYLCAPADPRCYSAALRDEAPGLRRAALEAAAWARVPGVVSYGRQCAARPSSDDFDALYVLAVLAGPQDIELVAAAASVPDLGPARPALIGALGSPSLVDTVLDEMMNPDVATAAAAGAAFSKLTGHDVRSGRTVSTAAPDGDPFEAEFAEQVPIPDVGRARAIWAQMRPTVSGVARLCRGFDVSRMVDAATVARLDLESRWECFLRARYYGAWQGTPADLERFPHPRP